MLQRERCAGAFYFKMTRCGTSFGMLWITLALDSRASGSGTRMFGPVIGHALFRSTFSERRTIQGVKHLPHCIDGIVRLFGTGGPCEEWPCEERPRTAAVPSGGQAHGKGRKLVDPRAGSNGDVHRRRGVAEPRQRPSHSPRPTREDTLQRTPRQGREDTLERTSRPG